MSTPDACTEPIKRDSDPVTTDRTGRFDYYGGESTEWCSTSSRHMAAAMAQD